MKFKAVCAVTAAAVAISLAGCGKREIGFAKKTPDTSYPEAVEADTILESVPDSASGDPKEDSPAETEPTETKKKSDKKKKTEKTEETTETTTAEPEPDIPDIRREQPYLGAAANDDFSDACFIGASQTVGLSLFGGKAAPDFFAYAGLNVKTVFTKKFLTEDGRNAAVSDSDGVDEDGLCTVLDVVGNKQYGRIYILFGLNELGGWIDYGQFYDGYVDLIRQIREVQPNAVIYVESVLPVSKYALDTNGKFTNENIDSFNINYIRPIAEATGSVYLNINPMFKCENGALAKNASSDGIHMTQSYCLEWMDMLAYYAPSGGPSAEHPMPQDYSPTPVTPGETSTPEDGLPAEIIPQSLPEVVIPDIPAETTAPNDDDTY